ncbi:hemerythrin domain-containing protein [Streptosporangium sp. NPDC048865]|uniref:hemerythrin domain-containing protein n=1 Tax=Streptosporangium sp. NPDC048865 TaxID=3155766 RepID=UPI00344A36C8
MTTRAVPMADVRDMYMAHTVFRREFGLMPELVRGVAEGDTARSEVVGAHLDLLCRILHSHHEGEDAIVWPRLQERGGREAAEIVPTMEGHHRAIEAILRRLGTLAPAWRATARGGAQVAEACEDLLVVLVEHMAMEEKEILPLAEKYITAAEWKGLGEHGVNSFSKRELALAFGLVMYEGDPEVVGQVLLEMPFPVRLLMPHIAPRAFAAHARRVHGTAVPPRAGRM